MKIGKWDQRFLGLAEHVAQWSHDPSTKVGAVIVRPDKTVASMGFNGFPRGIEDTMDRLQRRETKLKLTLHAEMNALLFLKEGCEGYTLYTWPLPPCSDCARHIIQKGVGRVVSSKVGLSARWTEPTMEAVNMFREAGVEVLWA